MRDVVVSRVDGDVGVSGIFAFMDSRRSVFDDRECLVPQVERHVNWPLAGSGEGPNCKRVNQRLGYAICSVLAGRDDSLDLFGDDFLGKHGVEFGCPVQRLDLRLAAKVHPAAAASGPGPHKRVGHCGEAGAVVAVQPFRDCS